MLMICRKTATPAKAMPTSKKPAKVADPPKKHEQADEVSPAATVTAAPKRATPKSFTAKTDTKAEEIKVETLQSTKKLTHALNYIPCAISVMCYFSY